MYGIGAAARVYFGRPAAQLALAEAATLAAMIQAPNRLSPRHDTKALVARRDWVLSRMEELGWAKPADVARAKAAPLGAKGGAPTNSAPTHLLSWVASQVQREEKARADEGRGFLVETTLDPLLQDQAERAVRRRLDALRRGYTRLRSAKLSAALVALDARSGAVLAYVGGHPDDKPGSFDRARSAKRQPGSVVKPFVALEALDACGDEEPLTASSRILDAPLRIERPSGPWSPENFDHEFHGPVLLREALAESRNVPAVRIARHCGFTATAARFEKLGLDLPDDPPPSFVLGAVETSPLVVAGAYTVFATPGRVLEPYAVARVETPAGTGLSRGGPSDRRASSASAAYIVRDLLRTAVEEGTAAGSAIAGLDVAAKTGTSSELRDAWFAGHAGSIVVVAWIGLDDNGRLGLTGAAAAGPLWRDFVAKAAVARPAYDVERPRDVVSAWVQDKTGLLVGEGRADAREELYRRSELPRRKHWWRIDHPLPVID
ncbi:MAG: transglycosylase domain-containing protein [Acidobacteria bacterium]|nr:transglycosylase domain-containing protein [Acidobacteriota bacterium]